MQDFNQIAYAFGLPESQGSIKSSAEDFIVEEQLGFDLTGEGEHLFLYIEKKGLNTEELVRSLSRTLKKSPRLISYAGLKDRQAITRQWISVHCPGEHIEDAETLQGTGWHVLRSQRHNKKLKKGALESNRFSIQVKGIDKPEEVEQRLLCVQSKGVPNYFGPQRFGHGGQNIVKAQQLLSGEIKVKDRFLKGIYYSAARAFLFNCILSQRVFDQTWNKALAGDLMQLAGTNSIFAVDVVDETLVKRMNEHDISPTAPLWGRGEEKISQEALMVQQQALADVEPMLNGLEAHDLAKTYRALILQVKNLSWEWQDTQLNLHFELPSGCYATAVLRELFITSTP